MSNPYEYNYETNMNPFPAKGQSSSVQSTVASINYDQDALRQKAEELERREAELQKREQELGGGDDSSKEPKPNFPICYPIVYHNPIAIEGKHRKFSTFASLIWTAVFAVILLLNFGVSLVSAILYPQASMSPLERVQYVVFSFLFLVIGLPAHFILVYWSYYQCMRTVHVFRFIICFITGLIPIAFSLFGLAGWYPYGASGIVVIVGVLASVTTSDTALAVFVLNLVMCIVWVICVIGFVLFYINIIVAFRLSRKTLKDVKTYAQEELVGQITSTISQGLTTAVGKAITAGATNTAEEN